MRTSFVAGSLLVALFQVAPLSAQHVAADVAIRTRAVAGRVVVGDGYSTYRRPVVVYRRAPARVIVAERVYVRGHQAFHNWSKRGFRPVVVYFRDGRYYDRYVRGGPPVREVVIYERDGRYYHVCDRHDWNDHYQGPQRYDGDHDHDWDD
jgi:hypothetical protein